MAGLIVCGTPADVSAAYTAPFAAPQNPGTQIKYPLVVPGVSHEVYQTETGNDRLTTLTDVRSGVTVSVIVADDNGQLPATQLPDGLVLNGVWLDPVDGISKRFYVPALLGRADAQALFAGRTRIDARDFGRLGFDIDDDNTTQVLAMIAEAGAADGDIRTIEFGETPWGVGIANARPVFGRGVFALGTVNVKGSLGSRPGAAFRLMTVDAGLEFGVEVQGTSIQGGRWGNFSVDAQGIAVQPVRERLMSQAVMLPVQVRNAGRDSDPSGANDPTGGGDPANDLAWHRANCAVLVDSVQNSDQWWNIANNAGCGMTVDRAASGNTFHVEIADSGSSAASPPPGGWSLVQQQSEDGTLPGAMSPQTASANNLYVGWGGMERSGPAAYGLVNHLAGTRTSIRDMFLADGKPNVGSRPLIRQRNLGSVPSGPLHIGKITGSGGKNTGTAMDIGDNCTLVLTDMSSWRGFKWAYKLGASARVYELTAQLWNVDAMLDPTSAGTLDECVLMASDGALVVRRQTASAPILRGIVVQQTAQVTTAVGNPVVPTSDNSVKFGPANAGAAFKIAAAGDLSVDGVTRNDLVTTVQSVATDGKSVTLNAAPQVALVGALANYNEKWHRVEVDADGTVKIGNGDASPSTVLGPAGWTALATLLAASSNPRVYKRAADETQQVTNSTAFVTDNKLVKPVNVSTEYRFDICVYPDGPANGDIQVGLVFPAGTTGSYDTRAPGTTAGAGGSPVSTSQTVLKALGVATTVGTVDTGNQQGVRISGRFTTGSTAGTFGLRWTQGTAQAAALTVKADSWIDVIPV